MKPSVEGIHSLKKINAQIATIYKYKKTPPTTEGLNFEPTKSLITMNALLK